MIGSVASLVTVTVPAQLSVAVGAVSVVTAHSAVISDRVVISGVGAVTSVITTSWVCVLVLPFASSYVQVTSVVPCAVIGSVASLVTVTVPPQLSVAVGAVSVVTAHSAVISVSVAISGVGAVISSTMTFWFWVTVFPLPSSKVQITV